MLLTHSTKVLSHDGVLFQALWVCCIAHSLASVSFDVASESYYYLGNTYFRGLIGAGCVLTYSFNLVFVCFLCSYFSLSNFHP